MNVVIISTPNVLPIANVNACDSYTLPALIVGNYFTGAGGTGTQLAAGTVLNTNQTVYVYAANTNGTTTCSDQESFVVTITTSPQFTVEGGCDGTSYVLEVVGGNFDSAQATYTWTNPSGSIIGTNSPTITINAPGSYTCEVTIGTCSTSFVFDANSTTCQIQKGISPNNDGLNDSFDLTGFNVKQLTLFNRYGGKVYAKANYTNEWRGQSDKGDELPDGTYYYVIERDGMEAKTGWIYVNREIK
jgi:gliding motility-associated-like protein